MTDGLDQALRNAGIDLLRADANLTVISGRIPTGQQPPYVRVYASVEWLGSADPNNALDGIAGRAVVRWYCYCVGGDDIAAVAVGQMVRTQLKDRRPTIAGVDPASVGMIQHEQDAPPTNDEATGVQVVSNLHVYGLTVNV